VQVDLGPPIGQVFIQSPEDLIIYKTWYFSLSRQTKHLRDISAVLAALGDQLDVVYVETFVLPPLAEGCGVHKTFGGSSQSERPNPSALIRSVDRRTCRRAGFCVHPPL
jgi:hypothetical protein